MDFLTSKPHLLWIGPNIYSILTFSTHAPHSCVRLSLVYYLHTHSQVYRTNLKFKFSSETTIVKWISQESRLFYCHMSDRTVKILLAAAQQNVEYRKGIWNLVSWCKDNNLVLNISKLKCSCWPEETGGWTQKSCRRDGQQLQVSWYSHHITWSLPTDSVVKNVH